MKHQDLRTPTTTIFFFTDMCQGLNFHYFRIIGDGKLKPIVGVYIPIIRIPIKGMTIPNIAIFDHGTYDDGIWVPIHY